MKVSIKVVTRSRPRHFPGRPWARVLIILVILIIVAVAAWVGYGPAAVIALFAGGGLVTQAAVRSLTEASP